MNLQLIEEIVGDVQRSCVEYFDLECAGSRLQLRRIATATPEWTATLATGNEDGPPAYEVADVAKGVVIPAPACGRLLHAHPLANDARATTGTAMKGEAIAFLQVGSLVSVITAPFDGFVQDRLVRDGALVDYGAEVLRFAAIAP